LPDNAALAQEAVDALESGATRTAPSQRGSFDAADGRRVAALVDRELLARGWRHFGRKLAFTDRSLWPKLGLDRPAWAYVYDRTVRSVVGGEGSFSLATRVAPRLETEIVVGLRRVPRLGAIPSEVAACVQWAAIGFEVIDCHYSAWKFTPADALADLVFHAGLIVGDRRVFDTEAEAMSWANALRDSTVTVRRGVDVEISGSPANVLGDPLQALAALIALIDEQGAEPMRAGELVTTGTMTMPFDLRAGVTVDAEMGALGLPPLRVRFS
jgi:2-keto-4-pentenoate hydratase